MYLDNRLFDLSLQGFLPIFMAFKNCFDDLIDFDDIDEFDDFYNFDDVGPKAF